MDKLWVLIERGEYDDFGYEVVAVTSNGLVAFDFQNDKHSNFRSHAHDRREAHEVPVISKWPV